MNESRVSSMNPPAAAPWSAEEEANRLMDDVFSDIDSLLSGKQQTSAKFQSSPAADYTSLQSVIVPQIDLAGTPFDVPDPLKDENAEILIKRGWGYYSERLFFMGSCASLLGVILWMAVNDRLKVPQFLTQTAPVAEVAPTADTTAEPIFANYVQRALDNIDRQQSPPQIPVAPQAVLAPDQTPANGQNPQVIERIYIPVYPPDMSAGSGQAIPKMPNVSTGMPQALTPPPQSKVVEPAPLAIAPPPPPLSAVPALPAPPAASKELYTLAGVLSGEVPTVLFKINGVTQRFKVGEEVGTSNWKIISAQDTQVLLGQGGQTKTVYIGEGFSGN